VTVSGDPDRIASVALLRSDHNTHSFTGGDRYVKLAFEQKDGEHKQGSPDTRKLRVRAPEVPAQAVPGIFGITTSVNKKSTTLPCQRKASRRPGARRAGRGRLLRSTTRRDPCLHRRERNHPGPGDDPVCAPNRR
jgi:Domain of unknown function (DUF1929)